MLRGTNIDGDRVSVFSSSISTKGPMRCVPFNFGTIENVGDRDSPPRAEAVLIPRLITVPFTSASSLIHGNARASLLPSAPSSGASLDTDVNREGARVLRFDGVESLRGRGTLVQVSAVTLALAQSDSGVSRCSSVAQIDYFEEIMLRRDQQTYPQ